MLRTLWDDPWQDFAMLRTDLDDMISRLGMRTDGSSAIRPTATLEERDDAIVMEFDLPGVSADRLEVEVDAQALSVRGHRRRGRRDLTYERQLVLPDNLDTETLNADLRDGVLTVSIAKSAKARKRRVEISGGEDQKTIDAGEAREPVSIGA
jgi:HSP20 family protein